MIKPIKSSIEKTKSGYRVRYRPGGRGGGQKSRLFYRLSDARMFQSDLLKGLSPRFEDPTGPHEKPATSFTAFTDLVISRHSELNNEESTTVNARNMLKTHLKPFFGHMNLRDIRFEDVEEFKRYLRKDAKNPKSGGFGLSPKTCNNYLRFLGLVFTLALSWEDDTGTPYLPKNPATKVKAFKLSEPDFRFWSFDEKRRALEWTHANDALAYAFLTVALDTGLRRGELALLFRDALDFDSGVLTAKRSYSFHARKEKHTKSSRIRRIPMNSSVRAVLEPHRRKGLREAVFPLSYAEKFGQKVLKTVCEKAEVTLIGTHDLRHTFGSHLAMRGVSGPKIQELMGHSSYEMTQRYLHLSPEHFQDETERLAVTLEDLAEVIPLRGR